MASTEKAVFRIHIRARVEDVWREITKTDEAQRCFFNMQLHATRLAPGGRMQMRTKSGKFTGAVGEILEFDPPRRYAHTFKFTHLEDPPCKVVYDLAEKDGGTEFTMTLEDLVPGSKTAKDMKGGGTMIINVLKAVCENGKPSLGTRLFHAFLRAMEVFSPKSTRVENWPL